MGQHTEVLKMTHSIMGEWMGSFYGPDGVRQDYYLFLEHTMQYERRVRVDGGREQIDRGHWKCHEKEQVLQLVSDSFDENRRNIDRYWILSIHTCETSNSLLVLRAAIVASRNLPILFYRVHNYRREHALDWED